jgi:glycosyltransferase involved in cell wall biosynthesis
LKVLIHHLTPFALAHGGLQIQIQRTHDSLRDAGVEIDYLRWYDERQTGDILHFFGRIPVHYLRLAHKKKMKVVMAELLTQQGARPKWKLKLQQAAMRWIGRMAPGIATQTFGWPSYRLADACIANTPWEKQLMHQLFGAPEDRIHVVPNGVEPVFFDSKPIPRGKWLVCTATITERKRVLELAQAAVRAKTPMWIIGKPYHESESYYQRFLPLVKREPQLLRYEGGISDRARLARIYREARGFALLSAMETLSLSADEAAACETPLLLSDLPWARTTFGDSSSYCRITGEVETARVLREFYDAAPTMKAPRRPPTWIEVARQFIKVYEQVLKDGTNEKTKDV